MVKVTPHGYVFRHQYGILPRVGGYGGTVLDLYVIGDDKGYRAFADSWILYDTWPGEQALPGYAYDAEVRADPDEIARWSDAQHTAENALRSAEAALLRDCGFISKITGPGARSLRRTHGWKAFAAVVIPGSSQRAAARFRRHVQDIEDVYAPVRADIVARVREIRPPAQPSWRPQTETPPPSRRQDQRDPRTETPPRRSDHHQQGPAGITGSDFGGGHFDGGSGHSVGGHFDGGGGYSSGGHSGGGFSIGGFGGY